jgi:hypothetical protein
VKLSGLFGKLIPFNQGNTKTQAGVAVILLLLIGAFATQCAKAGDSYVQMGLGTTVVRGPAAAIDLALVYPDAGPKDARIEVGATFIGGSEFKGQFQRNNFALRAAVVDGLGPVDVGIGVAYLQNIDTYNGSHVNFSLMLGYQFEKWSVRWIHFSNGGTVSPNKGRDGVYLLRKF